MLTVVLSIIAYLVCYVLNIVLAIVERSIVEHRKRIGNKKQIEHWLWAIIYCVAISPAWTIHHSWWLMASLVLCHFHVFGSAYQVVNDNNMFYLSKTSKAITERLLIMLGFTSAEKPYLVSLALSVYLLIKSFP